MPARKRASSRNVCPHAWRGPETARGAARPTAFRRRAAGMDIFAQTPREREWGEDMLSTLSGDEPRGRPVSSLVVIVLRALLLHRLPKELFFWLWMLALLRLLLPVFPASPLSVFARWEQPAAQWSASVVVQQAPQGEATLAPVAPQAPPVAVAPQAPAAPQASPAAAPEAGPDASAHARLAGRRPAAGAASGPCLRARPAPLSKRPAPCTAPFMRAWLKQSALRRPLEVRLCRAHRLADDLRRSAPGHPPARERRQGRHADAFVRAGA